MRQLNIIGFFDWQKEMDFLNQQLKQGFLLKDIQHHHYVFTQEALHGSYYIAYLTDVQQQAEFSDVAEEIIRIDNTSFYEIHRIHKHYKHAFFPPNTMFGTWYITFVPHSYEVCSLSDHKRKKKQYHFLFLRKLFEFLVALAVMVILTTWIAHESQQSFFAIYFRPLHALTTITSLDSYLITCFFIPSYVLILLYPFLFCFQLYQLYRLYVNIHALATILQDTKAISND